MGEEFLNSNRWYLRSVSPYFTPPNSLEFLSVYPPVFSFLFSMTYSPHHSSNTLTSISFHPVFCLELSQKPTKMPESTLTCISRISLTNTTIHSRYNSNSLWKLKLHDSGKNHLPPCLSLGPDGNAKSLSARRPPSMQWLSEDKITKQYYTSKAKI